MRRLALKFAAAHHRDGTPVLRLSEAWEFMVLLPGGMLP